MIRFLLLLLLPYALFATLNFNANNNKDVALLKSLDIDSSFLYDKELNDLKISERSSGQFDDFFQTMDDASLFIPRIRAVLSEYKIPPSFMYLAMAESNFCSKAKSECRASGIWQFMPPTAQKYHLKIDDYVDERRDLLKSSRAAAKYLSTLHREFGKWYLAILAYNCGSGTLSKAIAKAGTDDLNVLIDDDKKYLPPESRRLLRKVVALALVGNDEDFLISHKYEFLLNRGNAYSVASVKVTKGESLEYISQTTGISLSELKKLNRQLNFEITPPNIRNYEIYIPYSKLSDFKQKYHTQKVATKYQIHTVKKGETVAKIAKQYNIGEKTIKDLNQLSHRHLTSKQHIIIPVSKLSNNKEKAQYYVVKHGDTIGSIARAYKISEKSLKSINNLSSNHLRVGDKLYVEE